MYQDMEAIKAADKQRTKRAFVQFLATAMGVDGQTLRTDDGAIYNPPSGFYSHNPETGYAVDAIQAKPAPFVIDIDRLMIGAIIFLAIAAARRA